MSRRSKDMAPKCSCGEEDPALFISRNRSTCKNCLRTWSRERKREIKRQAVMYKGGACERCGFSKHQAALEFHHLDPTTKSSDYNQIWSRSFDLIRSELEKCELLCKNCHAEVTWNNENRS